MFGPTGSTFHTSLPSVEVQQTANLTRNLPSISVPFVSRTSMPREKWTMDLNDSDGSSQNLPRPPGFSEQHALDQVGAS